MKEPTHAIVVDVPQSKLDSMKKWLEETGHYKYIIYNPAAFYRDMLMFKIINGFETEIDWEDTLSPEYMDIFEKQGHCVKIGPRTEPGMWQHPDYTGLSENGNKMLCILRDQLRMNEELFGKEGAGNLVDHDIAQLEAAHKKVDYKAGVEELATAGRIKMTARDAYIEVMPTLK
jgi:hypothetical protein